MPGFFRYLRRRTIAVGTVPGVPRNVTLANIDLGIQRLTWTAPISNGGRAITGYYIRIQTGATVVVSGLVGVINQYDIPVTGSLSYTAWVYAVNPIGSGAEVASSTVTAWTNAVLGAPSALVIASSAEINTLGGGEGSLEFTLPAYPANTGSPVAYWEIWDVTSNTSVWGSMNALDYPAGTKVYARFPVPTTVTARTFKIHYYNETGGWGAYSATSVGYPMGVPNDPTASGTAIAIGSTQVTLYWTAPVNNNGSAITGYRVGVHLNDAWQSFVKSVDFSSSSTGGTITGLTNGTEYLFEIYSINAAGISGIVGDWPWGEGYHFPLAYRPFTIPSAPTGLNPVVASDTQVDLWWTPGFDGGYPYTSWQITSTPALPTGTYPGSVCTVTDGTSTSYSLTNLAQNTSYTFTVKGVTSKGTSAASAASVAVITYGPPLAPAAGVATSTKADNLIYGEGCIAVTTPTYPTSRGSAIDYFEVWDNLLNEQVWASYPPTVGTKCFFLRTIRQSTATGTYKVRFHNGWGWGAWSVATNAVVPFGLPADPVAGTTANTVGNATATVYFKPGLDNGSAYINYSIVRAYNTVTTASLTFNVAAAAAGVQTSCATTGLTNNVQYDFFVKTQNAMGYSNEFYLGSYIPYTVPATPSVTRAEVQSDTQAYIEWNLSSNNGRAITTFEVTTTPALPTGTYAGSKCLVAGDVGATGVTLTGLTPNTSYSVSVIAKNLAGSSAAGTKAFTGLAGAYTYGIPLAPSAPVMTGTNKALYDAYGAGAVSAATPAYPTSRGSAVDYIEIKDVTQGDTPYSYYPSAAGTALIIGGRTVGVNHYYQCRYHNGFGWGPWSANSAACMGASVPAAPTAMTFSSVTKISISVGKTAGATNGSAITGYHLWCTNGQEWPSESTGVVAHGGLTAGTNYGWTLAAKNALGEGPSIYAERATAP